MKAITKCPKCRETLTTNCRGCIDGSGCGCSQGHKNKCDYDDKVKWKKVPENEKELMEVEEI